MDSLIIKTPTLLVILACCLGYRACRILLRLRPARAQVIYNGYRKARARADGAFIRDNPPPMPLRVVDRIVFSVQDGRTIRVDLNRWAVPHDDTLLVWYDPIQPNEFTIVGPLHWLALAIASIGAAVWLSA